MFTGNIEFIKENLWKKAKNILCKCLKNSHNDNIQISVKSMDNLNPNSYYGFPNSKKPIFLIKKGISSVSVNDGKRGC